MFLIVYVIIPMFTMLYIGGTILDNKNKKGTN